jgi:nitrogen fixation-related uncharacterized protein
MEKTKQALIFIIAISIILFTIGFIAFFFTKKLRNNHIKMLNFLNRKKLVIFYKARLEMANQKWFLYNLKVGGLIIMLVGLVLFFYSLKRIL